MADWTASTALGELHQNTVAYYLDNAAAVASEARVDDFSAAFFQLRKRSDLVLAH